MMRTDYELAQCANFDFAWTTCCGGAAEVITWDDDFELPGHPGNKF